MKRSKNYNMYLPEKEDFYDVEDMNRNTEIMDEELNKIANAKVDKVLDKGLSTNDYTNTEKEKLKGIAEGAEANVQPDWNVTDATNDAYIKNKPKSMPASDVSAWAKAASKPSYTKDEIGLGSVPNVSTNDQTPTFTQASARTNIASGEKLSTILGKVMKWFADLKTVAFSGSYTDLSNKPAIPSKLSELLNDSGYKTTDNDTTYSAGAQLELSGTVFRVADNCARTTDWNSALTNGWYYSTADALNSPHPGTWYYGFVISQSADWKMQIVYSINTIGTNVVEQYWRIMTNGEWKEWLHGVDYSETAKFLKDSNGTYELFFGSELYTGARLRSVGPNGRLDFLFIDNLGNPVFFGTKNLATGATVDLGNSAYKWKNIYAATSTITTSDKSEKKDIKDLDETQTIDFIMGLKPKSFKFIDGSSGRTHHGMLSDDVEELLEKLGMSTLDFAGFIKSPKTRMVEKDGEFVEEVIEGEYIRGLRYEEFEADIIKMLQILWEKNGALEKENAELKAKISNIESVLEEIKNKLDM